MGRFLQCRHQEYAWLTCKWIALENMTRSQNYNGIQFFVTGTS